jgi:hypothetical protein
LAHRRFRHPCESADPSSIGPRFRGDDKNGATATTSQHFGQLVEVDQPPLAMGQSTAADGTPINHHRR